MISINKILLYLVLALLIFRRELGSIDNIVPIDTFPSLPSSIILEKHSLFLGFKMPGHINIIPLDKPNTKNKVLKNNLPLLVFYS